MTKSIKISLLFIIFFCQILVLTKFMIMKIYAQGFYTQSKYTVYNINEVEKSGVSKLEKYNLSDEDEKILLQPFLIMYSHRETYKRNSSFANEFNNILTFLSVVQIAILVILLNKFRKTINVKNRQ
jgi:hypothetical protein